MHDVVITGGEGFIAKNLIYKLKNAKLKIFVVKRKNGDLTLKKNWKKIPKSKCIVHLAGKSFAPDSWKDTHNFLKNNILSTQLALDYCKKYQSKLIFTSTVLYGGNYKSPLLETFEPKPQNPYHLSKYLCEQLCKFHHDNFKTKIVILRIFNPYGLEQGKRYVIPEITDMIKKNKIFLKNLIAKRDFIYIEDLIDAFLKAIKKNIKFSIKNIGSGKSYSIRQLAKIMMNIYGKKIPIKGKKLFRVNDYKEVYASINKAKRELGWSPKYTLKEGINHLKQQLK